MTVRKIVFYLSYTPGVLKSEGLSEYLKSFKRNRFFCQLSEDSEMSLVWSLGAHRPCASDKLRTFHKIMKSATKNIKH